ncbi:MAG: DUF3237 family protein [Marinilabiliaceae bacterium]|nr:DUF3237 family protein [Marinilabiliaceae bacterium]
MIELFKILVFITGVSHVTGTDMSVTMLRFNGHADSEYFKGEILPGGVDTQMHFTRDSTLLSARYMLKGVDANGDSCSVYICNEGYMTPRNGKTHPKIVTDSKVLSEACKGELSGTIEGAPGGIMIRLFKEEEKQ